MAKEEGRIHSLGTWQQLPFSIGRRREPVFVRLSGKHSRHYTFCVTMASVPSGSQSSPGVTPQPAVGCPKAINKHADVMLWCRR